MEGLAHPIGIEGNDVTTLELGFPRHAFPVVKHAERVGGGVQPFSCSIPSQHDWRRMATVEPAQSARLVVVHAHTHGRVTGGRRICWNK